MLKRLALCLLPVLAIAVNAMAIEANPANLVATLAAAKTGTVITLVPGSYRLGDLVIPSGVTVRGAGYANTIIDATGRKSGFILRDVADVSLSDVTICNAMENGVLARNAANVTLQRLMVRDNLTGLILDAVQKSSIGNLVVANNRSGASVANSVDSALVNCTFVGNTAVAVTLSNANGVAVFNNLFVDSPTAIYLGRNNPRLALDYNLYVASYIGKYEGEATRSRLPGWQKITGHDAHSLSMSITFADPEKHDYRPVSRLPWSQVLATSSNWGEPALLGLPAPATDIDGNARLGDIDLGAYEVAFPAQRPADGSFTIESPDGMKSAGLYTADGVNVHFFFHNLPLRKGTHQFWLPSRDYQNRAIAAGQYQVRVVESHLDNPYRGLAANFGASSDRLDNCSWPEEMFAFDAQDRLYIAQNAFENGMGIRAFDAGYATPRWMVPGGGSTVGVAVDATHLYYLQKTNLRKINQETGVIAEIIPGAGNLDLKDVFSGSQYGMAWLNGVLYISDPQKGAIFYAPAATPTFEKSFAVPGARSVTADSKTGLLWVIGAGGTLLAVDAVSGETKAKSTAVPGPRVISANNGRLAVLSPSTGKVYIFDCTNPAQLQPLRTIGTGDGPFGPMLAERFWFQMVGETSGGKIHVAINSQGEVAVVDTSRVSFWAADGTLKKQGMGMWGQHGYIGKFAGDDDIRLWNIDGRYSVKFDSKQQRWMPDTRWQLPDYVYNNRSPRAFFSTGGKNFGVFSVKVPHGEKGVDGFLVVRFDAHVGIPVTLYYPHAEHKSLVEVHDTNTDGIINNADDIIVVTMPDGKPAGIPGARYNGLPTLHGDLIFPSMGGGPTSSGVIIRMTGLDATGSYPRYAWHAPEVIPCLDTTNTTITSPYDYQTKEVINRSVQTAALSDGGYASSVQFKKSGGTGLANGAGTDIAGFSKEGRLRWLFKLNYIQGSEGVQSIPEHGLVLGMNTTQCEYMVMDEDGLGMGALAMPKEAYWHGMWSDHAQQQQAWIGNDGKPYYILGDYALNAHHWFEIAGMEKTRRQRVAVEIDEAKALLLAGLPGLTPETLPVPPTTQVTVRRLATALPMDGDLKKWRTAGIIPAALITPETGSAAISGPKDCSAVLRLAYHGTDLYVQTIVFDNLVTFHQSQKQMYMADGIEMAINSFMSGFKYNVAITSDLGPTVFRNRFVSAKLERIFTDAEVPRKITVLDSAAEVEERQLIEAIYGVDLSQSKVIITEFKLPLTAEVAFEGAPGVIKEIAPGQKFWIGFFINDNDMPGGDVQNLLAWPATYGTFSVKESGALATFE